MNLPPLVGAVMPMFRLLFNHWHQQTESGSRETEPKIFHLLSYWLNHFGVCQLLKEILNHIWNSGHLWLLLVISFHCMCRDNCLDRTTRTHGKINFHCFFLIIKKNSIKDIHIYLLLKIYKITTNVQKSNNQLKLLLLLNMVLHENNQHKIYQKN